MPWKSYAIREQCVGILKDFWSRKRLIGGVYTDGEQNFCSMGALASTFDPESDWSDSTDDGWDNAVTIPTGLNSDEVGMIVQTNDNQFIDNEGNERAMRSPDGIETIVSNWMNIPDKDD
jgi:hypothetical protein